MQNVSCI